MLPAKVLLLTVAQPGRENVGHWSTSTQPPFPPSQSSQVSSDRAGWRKKSFWWIFFMFCFSERLMLLKAWGQVASCTHLAALGHPKSVLGSCGHLWGGAY